MSETSDSNEPTPTEAPQPPAPAADASHAAPQALMTAQDASVGSSAPPVLAGAGRARKARSDADRAASRRASSDVGALRSFGLAIPFYGVALLAARLSPPSARAILLDRGWPPHATMAITCLAIAILLTKAFGLRRQRRAFALDLVPEGERIGPEAAARIVEHVESLRGFRGARSFLVERVLRVLSQFASRGEVAEASAANDADADADAASVAASFSTVKVLVWAMPILGLIGTVVGLSGAVGAFSHAMSGAEQLDTIKDSLREVTTGLAVAFDATFVALVASILVMLPMTWLQKSEDKLVNDVDDYCVTNVLARLGGRDQPAAGAEQANASPAALDARAIRDALVEAIGQPLGAMLSANARAIERMSEDRQALAGGQEALLAQLSAFAATLQQAAPAIERASVELQRATVQVGERLTPSVDRAAAEMGRATAQMGSGVERVVAALGESAGALLPSVERAASQLARTSAEATQGLERAVTQLERATVQVGERLAPSVERAAGQLEQATAALGAGVERAVTQLEVTTAVAEEAANAAERAQDQLSRELGASRQLLALLAAGLGGGDASSHAKPRHAANGANGSNGANGANAARGE